MIKPKIFSYVLAIVISLLFVQCTSKHKRLNQELTKIAAKLNKSTPQTLEENTRFDSVGVTPDNVFEYYYTITNTNNPNALFLIHKRDLMANLESMYSYDKSLQFFRKHKVNTEYIYRDSMQNVIDTITIKTDNYKNY